ncbi:MAG TPA: hypothetical protein IAC15_07880 [Candidatus Onthomonas avicola]|nr:hypothetical protein [Candidatus Onthomonas avicola]
MIRWLRGFSVVALALAVVIFAAAQIVDRMGQDDTMPEIACDSDTLEISCQYTTEELLAGVTAWDERDGDLTDQILVGSFSRFLEPGVCDLSYVVFDSSEHMATLSRRVHFTDYHSPRFSLSEPLCFAEGMTNNTEVRELFHASDVLDGDLTDWITYVETDAAYNNPGDYTITMEVRNSFGDTVSYAFPIHIYERNTQDLDISLTQPLVYVTQGDGFDPEDYVDSISDNSGDEYSLDLLEITSNVDTSTPGLYEVHYEIGNDTGAQEDGDDQLTSIEDDSLYGQIWLTVIVEEELA